MQRLFGGRHAVHDGRIVEVESPFLVIDVGGRGTNVARLEHALRIDIRDGLWPPESLRSRYRALVEPPPARTTEASAPARTTYVRLDDGGDVDIYCVTAPGDAVQGEAIWLDAALPLARALTRAREGERISWRSPSGDRHARVLAIGSDLTDVIER